MAAAGANRIVSKGMPALLLAGLYLFLYAPIVYVIYVSFNKDLIWPFPPQWTFAAYELLYTSSTYKEGLWNSVLLGLGSAILCTFFATMGSISILRYRSRWRGLIAVTYLAPLFIADLLVGISSLLFNRQVLDLPGNMGSAMIANAVHGTSFAFLIMLAQLARYDWRLDDAAMVFGAKPLRCFWEVTLPIIWPAMLGAFIIAFILGFNNLEISFYNLGAIPTLPTIAWGSLRFGLSQASELFALAALVNGAVLLAFTIMYLLMRYRIVSFGHRD
jgi:ABC-type spermidine/putrescine transport system permease subunit II